MAIFMSQAELERVGTDVGVVVARAEAYIVDLQQQLETQRARADAAAINVEQTCGLIEQKFLSLTDQYAQLEQEKESTTATLERRSTELAQAQAHCHRLELEAIKRDGEVEKLSFELAELRKAKRELLDVVDHKNGELDEKNASIKAYLDKIVSLTDDRSLSESKLHEHEAEVSRLRALQTRLAQEKEILKQHNTWLNEELTAKVSALLEERKISAETEADLRFKLSEAESRSEQLGESSRRNADRIKDLDSKLSQSREELKFALEDGSAKVDHLSAEIATAMKLADLYKESSEEWSKKSHELEGVISALETHLNEVESDYKEKLEREIKAREDAEKEAADFKEQLVKASNHIHNQGQSKEDLLALAPLSTPLVDITNERQLAIEVHSDGLGLPTGLPLSGTALAASLLRDGWSLATIYSKYQEAVDKWRHEKQERHHSQALLERVLHEIESKAEVIMDERAKHESMMRAYRVMEEKLRASMADQVALDNAIKDLKVELRKKERDLKATGKEVSDLQAQVSVLLKECADLRKRSGSTEEFHRNGNAVTDANSFGFKDTAADTVISSRLLAFKDIRGLVEQNSQLRTLVRTLAEENEEKEALFRETFEAELKKRTEKLVQKVADTVEKQEEQLQMMETLQATVRMYKRLHDEANASRLSSRSPVLAIGDGGDDLRRLLGSNQEEIQKLQKESAERIQIIEGELSLARQEVINLRVEQARADGAASYAKEQLEALMKDFENQRKEMEALLRRNMEYSQTITDYQRKLREHAQSVQTAEEHSRKLSIEVSVLNREKELLASAEKRASDEVTTLSDRLHRVQATLDTVESVKAFQENARLEEVKRLETELNRIQKEWTEARRELESERLRVGNLTIHRDQSVNQALDRVDTLRKELTDALKALSTAETRAQVAEARCADLEMSVRKAEEKVAAFVRGKPQDTDHSTSSADEQVIVSLQETKEELDKLKEELTAAQSHTDQYKRIATANGEALKQMEAAHTAFKDETERGKAAQELEISTLTKQLMELEANVAQKERATAEAVRAKEAELSTALSQLASLQNAQSSKQRALAEAEERIEILKKDIEKLHLQWREAQNNYERQVLLQADTIRELTASSEKLTQYEDELRVLRGRVELAEADLESSRVSWEMDRESLVSAKNDVENKLKELDEQNQLLLDRLEARHVIAADQAKKGAAEAGEHAHGDDAVQSVIRFLRRSKETSDTELSLMKQERLRLQKQLEAALRAAEDAQTSLRREHENARSSLHTEQDLKTLQVQVHELALLRETNAQLREENKKNFEDSKESRDKASKVQADFEVVQKRLREYEVDLEAAGKELELQRAETQRWQNRVSQLLDKYKSIDVEDYQQLKTQLAELQSELSEARNEAAQARERASNLERDLTAKDLKLSELEKRVQELTQTEATVRTDLERFRRHAMFLKKKIEALTKEKEEVVKENENLSKQVDESKGNSGRKTTGEATASSRQDAASRLEYTENVLKEQDVRIQTLEKTLERERDELRKEKVKRQKDQKAFYDIAEKAVAEKKKFLEDFQHFKQDLENGTRALSSSELGGSSSLEDRAHVYEAAVGPLSILASGVPLDTALLQSTPPVNAPTVVLQPVLAENPLPASLEPSTALSGATLPVAEATVTPSIPLSSSIGPSGSPAETSISASAEDPADISTRGHGDPDVCVVPHSASLLPAATQGDTAAHLNGVPGGQEMQVSNPVPGALIGSGASSRPRPTQPPVLRPPIRVSSTIGVAGITAPPVQTKEDLEVRIKELRASLMEKEKAQAQARKMTRKLIRPRIEPEIQAEVPELTTEVQLESQEMDTDATERVTVSSIQDSLEVAVTGTENISVDASGAFLEGTIISENISSSVLAGLSVGRKRPEAPSELQDLASDPMPPHKRARPVESSQVGPMHLDVLDPSGPTGSFESQKEDVEGLPSLPTVMVGDVKSILTDTHVSVTSAVTVLIDNSTAVVERESVSSDGFTGIPSSDTGNAVDVLGNDHCMEVGAATEMEAQQPVELSSTEVVAGLQGDLQLVVALPAEPALVKEVPFEDVEPVPADVVDEVLERSGGPERDDDAEDGEIMTDVMETAELPGVIEGANGVRQETVSESTQAHPHAEARGTTEGDAPFVDAPSAKGDLRLKPVVGAAGSSEVGHLLSQGEPSDLPRQIPQAAKGTTINLSERARERALLRRQVISPPSPGTRGARGRGTTKRSAGPGRGRLISTGVRTQGQPAGTAGESTQSGQASDASQTAPPSNTYEPSKDDQE